VSSGTPAPTNIHPLVPGEVILADAPVEIGDAPAVVMTVVNQGDRPIQVGSHFHFAETNRALAFDRAAGRGMRLAVPAGTSVRFEPGIERQVELVPLRGARRVPGLRGLVAGPLDGAAAAPGSPAPAAPEPGPVES
jgi:urease subunit beta